MDREYIKNELRNLSYLQDYVSRITTKSKGGMYVCPLCKSGTGKSKTGAFSIDKDKATWKCFSCNEGGDIFDLVGKVNNLPNFNEQFNKLVEEFNLEVTTIKPKEKTNSLEDKPVDYMEYYKRVSQDIEKTDCHRGISLNTLKRFMVGYEENWVNPKAPGTPATPRLIIPTSRTSYLARRTDGKDDNYRAIKVGKVHFLNIKSLSNNEEPTFIVEGELDALSIIDLGFNAVALGSINYVRKFIEELGNIENVKTPFIITFDTECNDNINKQEKELLKGLQTNGYRAELQSLFYASYKDANEYLQKDREGLFDLLNRQRERTFGRVQAEEGAKKDSYLLTSNAGYLNNFVGEIKESVNTPYITTGFKKLDDLLEGGLYEGLYIIGALTSLGKTTLTLQIMDNIAQAGYDCIMYALEMSRSEIIAKSVSRHTAELIIAGGGDMRNAKTVRGITVGSRYANYNELEKKTISQAIEKYSEYAIHNFIFEGDINTNIAKIEKDIEEHIRITGNKPVVFLDYIQILEPSDYHLSDKQNIDRAVKELKRISRKYKIPVVVVSSINRQSYNEAISMEAFKESGAIEYGADVLIGLQLEGAGGKGFDVDEAKARNPRAIELKLLKQRNGVSGGIVPFEYYTMFNLFKEV